jgi:uncharacterized membrane protein
MMKKYFALLVLCLYVLGAVGGFGFAMYQGAYLIAVAVVVLALMAFPTAQKYYEFLTD